MSKCDMCGCLENEIETLKEQLKKAVNIMKQLKPDNTIRKCDEDTVNLIDKFVNQK